MWNASNHRNLLGKNDKHFVRVSSGDLSRLHHMMRDRTESADHSITADLLCSIPLSVSALTTALVHHQQRHASAFSFSFFDTTNHITFMHPPREHCIVSYLASGGLMGTRTALHLRIQPGYQRSLPFDSWETFQ
jgi:hypothetical protein